MVYAREVQAGDEGRSLRGFAPFLRPLIGALAQANHMEDSRVWPAPACQVQMPGEPDAGAPGCRRRRLYQLAGLQLQFRLRDTRIFTGPCANRFRPWKRTCIRRVSQALAPAASRLLDHAKLVFTWHQRGFGRPGAESGGSGQWEAVRKAYVAALAAWQCAHPTTSVYREDIDRDGIEEVVVVNPTDMFVLSPIGGKMLYWYDLEHGDQVVGSDLGEAKRGRWSARLPGGSSGLRPHVM